MIRAALFTILPAIAAADPPRVEHAVAVRDGADWRVDVTLSHPDTGWDHYADGWRVLDETGAEIALRTLYHPHVEEQPFTRSLGRIAVAAGTRRLFVEPRCTADGWTGERYPVDLPR